MTTADRNGMRREFLEWCERERVDAAEQLSRFEAGLLKVGTAGPAGYVDNSPAMMDHLRNIISSMDALIPKVREDLDREDVDRQ